MKCNNKMIQSALNTNVKDLVHHLLQKGKMYSIPISISFAVENASETNSKFYCVLNSLKRSKQENGLQKNFYFSCRNGGSIQRSPIKMKYFTLVLSTKKAMYVI